MKKLLFVTLSTLSIFGCLLSPEKEGQTIKVDCNKPANHKVYSDSAGAFHQTIDCSTDTTKADSVIFPDKEPKSMGGWDGRL